jgi:hypothetical protein
MRIIIWEHNSKWRRVTLGHDGIRYSVLDYALVQLRVDTMVGGEAGLAVGSVRWQEGVDLEFDHLDDALYHIKTLKVEPPTKAEVALKHLAR